MKDKLDELSTRLKNLHRQFLDNERQETERQIGRKITPYDFFHMLTQDKSFAWLQPFSALLAEIDAFIDESESISEADLKRIKEQVNAILHTPGSKIEERYKHHLFHDGEFILYHSWVAKALKDLG